MALIMRYSQNAMLKHPKTLEEFKALMDEIVELDKAEDRDGLLRAVIQIVPDLVAEDVEDD